METQYYFFLKYLLELPTEGLWAWSFLCGKFFFFLPNLLAFYLIFISEKVFIFAFIFERYFCWSWNPRLMIVFPLKFFKDFSILSSCLHWFQREICCHPYLCPLVCDIYLSPSGYFQNIPFITDIEQFDYDVPWRSFPYA